MDCTYIMQFIFILRNKSIVFVCLFLGEIAAGFAEPGNVIHYLNQTSIYFFVQETDSKNKQDLCSGTRVSPKHVVIEGSCYEKLKGHELHGDKILGESKSGIHFGEVTLEYQNENYEDSEPTVQRATIECTDKNDVHWFTVNDDEYSWNKELLTLHYDGDTIIEGKARCGNDKCEVSVKDVEEDYADGTPVYNENKLLCLMSESKHCIRPRSAVVALDDLCQNWSSLHARLGSGQECKEAGCPNADGQCCIYRDGAAKLLRCNHCSNPNIPTDCGPNSNITYCTMSNNIDGGVCSCGLSRSIDFQAPENRRDCSHRIPGSEGLAPGNFIPIVVMGTLFGAAVSVCVVLVCLNQILLIRRRCMDE